MEDKKKSGHMSEKQKKLLISYMEKEHDLRTGKFTNDFTHKIAKNKWISITNELNSIPGTQKEWTSWRRTWQDLKKNTKKKTSEMRKYAQGTGGGPFVPPVKIFTEDDENILKLLEPTAVDGDPLVQESVVIFDHDYDYNINKGDMVTDVVTDIIEEVVTTENEVLQDKANFNSQTSNAKENKKRTRMVAAKRLSESLKTSQNISRILETKVSSKDKYYSQKIDLYKIDVEAKERIAKALEIIAEKIFNVF